MCKTISICAIFALSFSGIASSATTMRYDMETKDRTTKNRAKSIEKTSAYGFLLGTLVGAYQSAILSPYRIKTTAYLALGSILSGTGWAFGRLVQENDNALVDEIECGACGMASVTAGYLLGLTVGSYGRVCADYLLDEDGERVEDALSKLLKVFVKLSALIRNSQEIRRSSAF